jgi:tetratricopeptide (TPR) repeat protein
MALTSFFVKFWSILIRARRFILLAFCFFVLYEISSMPALKNKRELIAPPPMMERFSFGFSELMADLIWLRAIQDFDYCEQEIAQKNCQGNSWLYQMLDAAMNLSPKFRKPAAVGGLALTVLVNDMTGASKIFDRSVAAFPDDWAILYRASYHALYEEKDKLKAGKLLQRAAQLGGPEWLYQLASKLYTESGEKELAFRMYEDIKSQDLPEGILKTIRERLNIRQ